jgi:hypothetical protein
MTSASMTQIYRDVVSTGATRRKIIRAKDTTIRQLKNGYMYIDADDPTLNAQARQGHSLIGGWRYIYDSTISVAEDAIFNNQPCFSTTGNQHFMKVFTAPNLESFTFMAVLSIPQTVIDEAEAFTLNQNYVYVVYNEVANVFLAGVNLFASGGNAGWAVNSLIGSSGTSMNTLWSAFPGTKPVADTPFIICWAYDAPTTTGRFYFNDGTTAVQSKTNHAGSAPGGGDGRIWPMSFGDGSNTVGWRGKMACMLFSDDTDDSLRMTDAQRIAIMSELRAAYDIS